MKAYEANCKKQGLSSTASLMTCESAFMPSTLPDEFKLCDSVQVFVNWSLDFCALDQLPSSRTTNKASLANNSNYDWSYTKEHA